MILRLLQLLKDNPNSSTVFYGMEIGILFVILFAAWLFRPRSPESNFRVRESDLRKPKARLSPKQPDLLAEAKLRAAQKTGPLLLEGLRLDGSPSEILGISAQAGPEEIQKAFREKMKRYHPDKVGPPGSREWQDAQNIAHRIVQAKDEMMKKWKN